MISVLFSFHKYIFLFQSGSWNLVRLPIRQLVPEDVFFFSLENCWEIDVKNICDIFFYFLLLFFIKIDFITCLCFQHSSPEIKWVDGGRPLFRLSTHLVSTIYTQVQLHMIYNYLFILLLLISIFLRLLVILQSIIVHLLRISTCTTSSIIFRVFSPRPRGQLRVSLSNTSRWVLCS